MDLVVWTMICFIFPFILFFLIKEFHRDPTDEVIFFRGVGLNHQPIPTRDPDGSMGLEAEFPPNEVPRFQRNDSFPP